MSDEYELTEHELRIEELIRQLRKYRMSTEKIGIRMRELKEQKQSASSKKVQLSIVLNLMRLDARALRLQQRAEETMTELMKMQEQAE